MKKTLMVPVHLDALCLVLTEPAAEPTADFRGLPYYDPLERRDVNSDTPWLSDSVISPPFENSNGSLQAGIHLHWALPDGLCHGKVEGGRLEMPTVPNRWLIRRRLIRRRKQESIPEKIWILESDYLWSSNSQDHAVNIFFQSSDKAEGDASNPCPYRFLGRKFTEKEWTTFKTQGGSEVADYYKLTALGYGEPTFSAYYQNCKSVFGFHDSEIVSQMANRGNEWPQIQYDVLGWYENSSSPALTWRSPPSTSDKDKTSFIEEFRRWQVDEELNPSASICCYASITVKPSQQTQKGSDYTVSIGNTPSEALSALLTKEVMESVEADLSDQNLVNKIEEQLESLHIESQLKSETQDIRLRLQHYRHEKSFDPVPGSQRWRIQVDQPGVGRLPEEILDGLHQLNQLQARYGRQQSELTQSRNQLYGDWSNYMRNVYRSPDGGRGQYLDIDEVKQYIEDRSLRKVKKLVDIVERTKDALETQKGDLETRLSTFNQLNRELAADAEPQAARTPMQYTLTLVPGSRFWQPKDPVVLIAGKGVRANERHHDGRKSKDGFLRCGIYTDAEADPDPMADLTADLSNPQIRQQYFDWIDQDDNSLGIRTVEHRPWNPLFLDWGVDLYPAESRGFQEPGSYDPDVITDNYQLGSLEPDLQRGSLWRNDNPDRFSGRCILGSTVSMVLRSRLEDFLKRHLHDGLLLIWQAKPDNSDDRTYINDLLPKWFEARANNANEDYLKLQKLVGAWVNLASLGEAELDFLKALVDWFKELATDYSEVPLERFPTTWPELDSLVAWYKKRPMRAGGDRLDDPLYCAILAYQQLFERDNSEQLQPRAFLSQSLVGLNQELLQRKQGLTLPVAEPIGLKPYQDFTQKVADAVGDELSWSPDPTNNFSPIRSGVLTLDKLRVIDSFGQVADIPVDKQVIVSTPYQDEAAGQPGLAFFPPRLIQAARACFRWLDSAPHMSREMQDSDVHSPICGWLLPEKLSGRLLVFDAEGNPLGALAADKDKVKRQEKKTLEWVRAPGLSRVVDPDKLEEGRSWLSGVSPKYYRNATQDLTEEHLTDLGELGASIQNRRLARILLYLWATGSQDFLDSFLNILEDASAKIDPEGVTSMGSLVLLVGRPVAVVGAEVNLELKDAPAIRQDWDAFFTDQFRHERDHDRFPEVQLPLRLGQYHSMNDGVLGYWLEDASGGFEQETFVAQAADDDPTRVLESEVGHGDLTFRINAHEANAKPGDDELNFTQSVADPPLQTTILFDPRGRATLTTGILPAKTIDIPRQLWEPALESIRVWFPVAPLLSRVGSRRVPTPELVDQSWQWLEYLKADNWRSLETRPTLSRVALSHILTDQNHDHRAIDKTDYSKIAKFLEQVKGLTPLPSMTELLDKAWLKELSPPGDRLYLGEKEGRKPLAQWSLEAPLEILLQTLAISLVSPGDDPNLTTPTEVREGWLQLNPNPKPEVSKS